MNHLDELLASTGRVPGLTPDGLLNARAAVDAATAEASPERNAAQRQPGAHASRKAANHWWGGLPGKAIIGVAGAAAAAAAATVIVIPSSSPHPGASPLAGSSSGTTVKAKPSKSIEASGTAPVTYKISSATTDVTAALVLQQAASQLVDGWPNAPYWHTVQQFASPMCPGQISVSDVWMDRSGNGVGVTTTTGPKSSNPMCGTITGKEKVYPITNGTDVSSDVSIGQKGYTWSQLAALPTDPAKLWPIVKADEQLPFTADPGFLKSGQSDLFESIWNVLTSEPLSPALRKALYKVSAEIPGVTVAGTYADSLGRTGTALHIGLFTMVVDTSNGQILAMIQGPPAVPPGCVRATDTTNPHNVKCMVSDGSTTVYISAGPATSEP
jgi:hypothetical protein